MSDESCVHSRVYSRRFTGRDTWDRFGRPEEGEEIDGRNTTIHLSCIVLVFDIGSS